MKSRSTLAIGPTTLDRAFPINVFLTLQSMATCVDSPIPILL